jgi:aminomethyltransferase
MAQQTPLYAWHCDAGAYMVDFSGWQMPLHYGSQIQEHQAVREAVGVFDVSHMGVIDIQGAGACAFLQHVLANDVAKLTTSGKALYSCMLNEHGGVVDDLIVYYRHENEYRLVVNAGTKAKDYAWLVQHSSDFQVTLSERPDYSIIAVQGPKAINVVSTIFPDTVSEKLVTAKPFHFLEWDKWTIARTGYTGEEGVEVILPGNEASKFWQQLIAAGAQPCGLGARDTLRLEAGLNLYGVDMTDDISPLVSNLAWTVSFKDEARNFIGKSALLAQKDAGIKEHMVGLVMTSPGVLRNHQKIKINGNGEGEITSGGFSPSLGHAIALARLPIEANGEMTVDRRGKDVVVELVKPPFVRHGKKLI